MTGMKVSQAGCVAALILAFTAAPAFAEDESVINVEANVAAICNLGMGPTASVPLGVIVDLGTGGYDGPASITGEDLQAQIGSTGFWCNGAASTVDFTLTPLTRQGPPADVDDVLFTDRVHLVSTLAFGDVDLPYDTTAPIPIDALLTGVFSAELSGTLTFVDPGLTRLVAGDYEALLNITLSAAP